MCIMFIILFMFIIYIIFIMIILFIILFIMFIFLARYAGIRRPFHHRAEDQCTLLGMILLTWCLGLLLACPIPILALVDIHNVMPHTGLCQISNRYFVIIGSLLSFYFPLIIIIIMYCLTVRLLKNQAGKVLAGKRHIRLSSYSVNTQDKNQHPIDATQHTVK